MEKSRNSANSSSATPDPEVSAIPRRRTFTANYKLEILKQVDACKDRPAAVGEILRREGLYSSHLTEWRKERDRGALEALGKKGGRKPSRHPHVDEIEKLRRENPEVGFLGVDREASTTALNRSAYSADNLTFRAGEILDVLPAAVDPRGTVLFHARTACLCYPAFIQRLYNECARPNVKAIALYENRSLGRLQMEFFLNGSEWASHAYHQVMFIHNYQKMLESAGYRVVHQSCMNYSDIVLPTELACDSHEFTIAVRD